jgi:NAD(P)-dependent dehydrogenase (short-subunit alcohol dehydrogenase family)
MAGRLTGKVALVTGGTRGIGAAVVRAFVSENAKVVFLGRNENLGKSIMAELKDAIYFKGDMTVKKDLENCVRNVLEKFGAIDILVNNAGIFPAVPFLDIDEGGLDQILGVNQKGLFMLSQMVAKGMVSRKQGCIINMASIQGLQGLPVQSHYSATKGASIGLTRALAAELGPMGIRVNAIAPGAIMTEGIRENIPQALVDIVSKHTPLGRLATVQDIAACAVFLASDDAKSITGQVITVDGGYTATRMFV